MNEHQHLIEQEARAHVAALNRIADDYHERLITTAEWRHSTRAQWATIEMDPEVEATVRAMLREEVTRG